MAAERGGWRVCADSDCKGDREESPERREDVPRVVNFFKGYFISVTITGECFLGSHPFPN